MMREQDNRWRAAFYYCGYEVAGHLRWEEVRRPGSRSQMLGQNWWPYMGPVSQSLVYQALLADALAECARLRDEQERTRRQLKARVSELEALAQGPHTNWAKVKDAQLRAEAAESCSGQWLRERNTAIAERDRLHAVLLGLLGLSSPWPLHNVMERLAQAANHLLRDGHSCDCHGYEEIEECERLAREFAGTCREAMAVLHGGSKG